MTCLCLTRNRRKWLPQAIDCYRVQTYAHRELLILSDGEDVRDLVPSDDPSILHVHIAGAPEIGEKRNFGCNLAAGEVVAHWDDDDFSAPGRLGDQVARLLETRKPVTGYHSMRFTDGARWWRYANPNPAYSLGTALCFRRDWWQAHPFPPKQVAEDEDFVREAHRHDAIVSVAGDEFMHASIHPQNTSPRNLTGAFWKQL